MFFGCAERILPIQWPRAARRGFCRTVDGRHRPPPNYLKIHSTLLNTPKSGGRRFGGRNPMAGSLDPFPVTIYRFELLD
jgi:hypothetical protein